MTNVLAEKVEGSGVQIKKSMRIILLLYPSAFKVLKRMHEVREDGVWFRI